MKQFLKNPASIFNIENVEIGTTQLAFNKQLPGFKLPAPFTQLRIEIPQIDY